LKPPDALEAALGGAPIAFVDDIIGSGQQLTNTWDRPYRRDPPKSFADAFTVKPFPAFCLAVMATETALRNVAAAAPAISIVATHVLDASYSVECLEAPPLTPSIPNFQDALRSFLTRHAATLTLEPFLQSGRQPLFGFHELGLLFAIQGAVPDCTVPLVWAPGPDSWVRLVRKDV
jgi:hypothetical protein